MVESIKNTISRMEPSKANNNHAVPQTAINQLQLHHQTIV